MSSPHIAGLAAFILGEHPDVEPDGGQVGDDDHRLRPETPTARPTPNPFDAGCRSRRPEEVLRPGPRRHVGRDRLDRLPDGSGPLRRPGPRLDPGVAATDLNIPSMAKGQVTSSVTIKRTFTALKAGTWNVAATVPGFDVAIADSSGDASFTLAAGAKETVTFTFTRTTADAGPVLDRFRDAHRDHDGPAPDRPATGVGLGPGRGHGQGCHGQRRRRHHGRLHRLRSTSSRAGSPGRPPTPAPSPSARSTTTRSRSRRTRSSPASRGRDQQRGRPGPLRLRAQRRGRAGRAGRPVGHRIRGRAGHPDEPEGGNYLVEVDGYAAATGESGVAYRYDRYLVTPAAPRSAGSLPTRPGRRRPRARRPPSRRCGPGSPRVATWARSSTTGRLRRPSSRWTCPDLSRAARTRSAGVTPLRGHARRRVRAPHGG